MAIGLTVGQAIAGMHSFILIQEDRDLNAIDESVNAISTVMQVL